MNIKDILHETENKMKRTLEAVTRELSEMRTGRASPGLVEGVMVNYYGTPTALKQLATISTPQPRLIVIHPWDPSALSEVEKAILKSNLGITPNSDGKLIRISIPALTDERRQELDKIIKKIAENGRVSIRTARRDANEGLKSLEKNKKIAEDQRFTSQSEVQKTTDRYIEEIDKLLDKKEKEILE